MVLLCFFYEIRKNSQRLPGLGKTDAWLLGCDARPRQTALVSRLLRPMWANHSSSDRENFNTVTPNTKSTEDGSQHWQ